jgi:hypothetical protein
VFVANPNKPPAIVEILANNRDKLLKYLEDFHTDKGECAGKVDMKDWLASCHVMSCIGEARGDWCGLSWLWTL